MLTLAFSIMTCALVTKVLAWPRTSYNTNKLGFTVMLKSQWCIKTNTHYCRKYTFGLSETRFPQNKPTKSSSPKDQSLRISWTRWFDGFPTISNSLISCSASKTQTEMDQSTCRISSRVIHFLSALSSPVWTSCGKCTRLRLLALFTIIKQWCFL